MTQLKGHILYNLSMIAFLKGTVHLFQKDFVLIDVKGVGYRVFYRHQDELKVGQEVFLYTYQHVTENDMVLYGFRDEEEYETFTRLITVRGIGPKLAANILALSSSKEIANAIENEDVNYIKSIPGIGLKTANQLILDLKGKIGTTLKDSKLISDLNDALSSLGFKKQEISKAISKMKLKDTDLNDAIKKALSILRK